MNKYHSTDEKFSCKICGERFNGVHRVSQMSADEREGGEYTDMSKKTKDRLRDPAL